MPCERIDTPQGTIIACSRRRGPQKCYVCGHPAKILCDRPTPTEDNPKATCSRPVCRAHAHYGGRVGDLCEGCFNEREG